ncbi:Mitochondrial inner membrane protease subunit 2-like protein [Drosera capensis]
MSSRNLIWDFTKKCFTFSIIALTISDRYASITPVRGQSMSPTLNPVAGEGESFLGFSSDDYVLVEKFCLRKYQFSHGDVIVFSSPHNHKEKNIKRIIGLPGDWLRLSSSRDTVKVPEGHCWVEGDNAASSFDSRSFGPIPLGLAHGRATHVLWPPQRIGQLQRIFPHDSLSSF